MRREGGSSRGGPGMARLVVYGGLALSRLGHQDVFVGFEGLGDVGGEELFSVGEEALSGVIQ